MLKNYLKIFVLASTLLIARFQNNYQYIGLVVLLIFLALFLITKKTEDKLFYFLFFQFFEYFELIDGVPLSIPYSIIATYILFIFLKNLYRACTFLIISSVVCVYAYYVDSIYQIKLFLTYLIIYISCRELKFLDSKKYFLNIKKIKIYHIFLIFFWILEAASHFIFQNFKNNILVGNDYRPIGFFSEPTYFIYLIGLTSIIISSFYFKNLLISLLISIYSQSRIITPFLYFYLVKNRTILMVLSFILLFIYFSFFIDNNSFFNRFIDINDSLRWGFLNNALNFISFDYLLVPPNSYDLHRTGIFYFQLVNVFGGLIGSVMFILLAVNVVSKTGYIGLVIIVTSFVHPIQYSAISLSYLILGFYFKNVNSRK